MLDADLGMLDAGLGMLDAGLGLLDAALGLLTLTKVSLRAERVVGVTSSLTMLPIWVFSPVRHTMASTSSSASSGFHTCTFIHACTQACMHSLIHSFTLFVGLLICSFVHSTVCPFVRSVIHSAVHRFIHPPVRPWNLLKQSMHGKRVVFCALYIRNYKGNKILHLSQATGHNTGRCN